MTRIASTETEEKEESTEETTGCCSFGDIKCCEEKDEEGRPTLEYFFAANTTCHGFGKIAKSQSCSRKAFWSVILIAALMFCCFQLYHLLLVYFSERPSSTDEITRV